MPVARFEMPDGRIARFEVPEGTTPEQAQAQIEAMIAGGLTEGDNVQPTPQGGGNAPGQGSGLLNVLGEAAAAANKGAIAIPDTLADAANYAIGGWKGLGRLATGQGLDAAVEATQERPVPRPSEVVRSTTGHTPGQGGFMEPGAARDIVQAGGALIPAAAGVYPVQRQAGAVGNAVLDVLGVGASSVAGAAGRGGKAAADLVTSNTPPSIPMRRGMKAAELPLKRGAGDASTFGYKLDAAGKVVADPSQQRAANQGFDKGFVTMVKSAPDAAKQKFRQMVDVVEKGKENYRYQAMNRPLDVAGDSIVQRFDVVRSANRVAASRLDDVAKSLKGQRVDVRPAVDSLLGKLDDMGIKFDPASGKLDFSGSDLEKLPGPQRVVRNMLDRMRNTRAPDAYDIHRMKKFIDEQVSYGKSQRGLGGRAESIFKALRHDLDGILDEAFPAYNRVNTQYAETRQAMDALQDVAGQKMNLLSENADKAVGTLTRRLLSNAQSRVPLMDAVDQLDQVAKKYLTPGNEIVPYKAVSRAAGRGRPALTLEDLDDDVIGQVMFVDELEKVFGTHARTSLQGDAAKAIDRGIEGGSRAVMVEGARSVMNKARGINEESAMKAIKDLLREGQ